MYTPLARAPPSDKTRPLRCPSWNPAPGGVHGPSPACEASIVKYFGVKLFWEINLAAVKKKAGNYPYLMLF